MRQQLKKEVREKTIRALTNLLENEDLGVLLAEVLEDDGVQFEFAEMVKEQVVHKLRVMIGEAQ